MKVTKKKKNAPRKRDQLPKEKVRQNVGKKKKSEDLQELVRVWDEDLCE